MPKHTPDFSIFPHEKRFVAVTKDGRPYFRSYVPNFVSGVEPKHFFFDSLEDLTAFLTESFPYYNHITLEYETCYYPEWIVIGYCKNPNEGHWILGFASNLDKYDIPQSGKIIFKKEVNDAKASRS